MQLSNVVNKINQGKQEFQNATFFMANYIKVNLTTWSCLSEYISEEGDLEGLKILIDYNLEDKYAIIGMGNGPTTAKIRF